MIARCFQQINVASIALRYVERRHEARARNGVIDECHARASTVLGPIDIGIDQMTMVAQETGASI